jgi:hypothetical protein
LAGVSDEKDAQAEIEEAAGHAHTHPDALAAAQVMQVRAAGRAASRSAAIGRPQRSHRP